MSISGELSMEQLSNESEESLTAFPEYDLLMQEKEELMQEEPLWDPIAWFMSQSTLIKVIVAILALALIIGVIFLILKIIGFFI